MLNASLNMRPNTAGTSAARVTMMYSTITKYTPTMNGTITEATRAMRVMPPRITAATTMAMAQPKSSLYACRLSSPTAPPTVDSSPLASMPSGVENVVTNASVSWLAFMIHRVPKRPATAKKRAIGVQRGPSPRVITCIGPPWGRPISSVPLYMVASTPSWYLVAMPTMALTHIQKMAPGPPTTSAMATPAILPSPTVAAITDARACTLDIWPSPPECLRLSSPIAAGSRRSDTIPEEMSRYRPPPMSRKKSG